MTREGLFESYGPLIDSKQRVTFFGSEERHVLAAYQSSAVHFRLIVERPDDHS